MQQRQWRELTGEALGRIRAAAPPKNDLDLEKLRDDLQAAHALYLIGIEFRRGGTKLQRKLVSLSKAVGRVKELLDDEQVWEHLAWHKPPDEQRPRQDLRQLVVLLRTAVDWPLSYRRAAEPPWQVQYTRQFIDELGVEERSAAEWLAGQHLPQLYEKHFGLKANFSRN